MPAVDPLRQVALELLACLEDMGTRHSNPVLEVLPAEGGVMAQHRYPPEGVRFAGDSWRAYYHCHDYPDRDTAEHGHFHIFLRVSENGTGMENWGHVAGLAMDKQGQPMHWFAVNRWVTDGAWLPSSALQEQVLALTLTDDKPIARWLLAMLKLYEKDLLQLLRARDDALAQCSADDTAALLEDRGLYGLASGNINLVSQLEAALTD
jgi:hypothetical protein